MKIKIPYLIVVEGKSDINFLSNFLDANFYSINGSAVNYDDIKFLKNITKNSKIIILTDPDFPGQKIRNFINENLNHNVLNAYIRKEYSIKKNKVGVAESTKEEIIRALQFLKEYKESNISKSDLEMIDLYNYKLVGSTSSENRMNFCNYYGLGYSNGKSLLKKLKLLGINKNALKEMINNVNS